MQNEIMSDDILRRSIDDTYVKFKIKVIKHDTSDKTNKSENQIKDKV